jgi:recombination protein RecR
MYLKSRLLEKAVENLSSLPGIGKRTALRLVLSLLKKNKNTVQNFGNSFIELVNNIKYCNNCHAISETDLCSICTDHRRDHSQICVVEDIRVMLAIENTMQYKGIYHVLGGLISPMDGIGPDDLKIDDLINKVSSNNIKEVIFALSTTMEGDTTNFYLFKKLDKKNIKISSIARGISIGDELEYTDKITLATALSSRLPYENSLTK